MSHHQADYQPARVVSLGYPTTANVSKDSPNNKQPFLASGSGFDEPTCFLLSAHPEWLITVLLRHVPPDFTSTYPQRLRYQRDHFTGSGERRHCNLLQRTDYETSLIAGLKSRDEPGYLIHLSGTGIVSDWADETHLGRLNPKAWSDTDPCVSGRDQKPTGHGTAPQHREDAALPDCIARYSVKGECGYYMSARHLRARNRHRQDKTHSALIPMFVKESRNLGTVFRHSEGAHIRPCTRVLASRGRRGEEQATRSQPVLRAEHIPLRRHTGALHIARGPWAAGCYIWWISRTSLGWRDMYAITSRTRADRARKLWGYQSEAPGLMEALAEDVADALGESGE